jgi:hypothetical protein
MALSFERLRTEVPIRATESSLPILGERWLEEPE